MSALAQRYAQATLRAMTHAFTGKDFAPQVTKLADSITMVAEATQQHEALRLALHNPSMQESRAKAVDTLLQRLGVDGHAARLVRVLLNHGRVDLLQEVAEALVDAADAAVGRVRATVDSAVPLSEAQMGRLEQALKIRLGQPVLIHQRLVPSIKGGLVCRVKDVTYDHSLQRQLERLSEQLSGSGTNS